MELLKELLKKSLNELLEDFETETLEELFQIPLEVPERNFKTFSGGIFLTKISEAIYEVITWRILDGYFL